jgi:hypothetical protein
VIHPLRRARQAVTLARNLWFLRGELWRWHRRRRPEVVELRCLRCRRPLTKPCRGGRHRPHVIRYPEGFGDPALAGKVFFVEQTHGNRPAKVWEKT